jgi:hypothetical protein
VLQLAVQAVEERLLEDEAGLDVVAGQGQQARLDLVRMLGGIDANPVGIGLHDLAQVGRQFAVVGVGGRPDVEQSGDIVGRRGGLALAAGQHAAGGQHNVLQGVEIVLALGVGQAEGGVGVGLAQHMRHAPLVAAYADVIGLGLVQQGVAGRDLGQAGLVDDDQSPPPAPRAPAARRSHAGSTSSKPPRPILFITADHVWPAWSCLEPVSTKAG